MSQQEKLFCPFCGQLHPTTAEFCPNTGEKIPRDLIKPVCPDCGFSINEEWENCPNCGKSLQSTTSTKTNDKKRKIAWLVIGLAGIFLITTGFLFIKDSFFFSGKSVNHFSANDGNNVEEEILTNEMNTNSAAGAVDKSEAELTPANITRVTTSTPLATNKPAMTKETFSETPTRTVTATSYSSRTATSTFFPSETIQAYFPIAGCSHSIIHQGDWVTTSSELDDLFLRSEPDTHPSNNIIGNLVPGELAQIIDGPECNYGWILWKVRKTEGDIGWIAESSGDDFWLKVLESHEICEGYPNSLVKRGDRAYVAFLPPISNRVRENAGTSQKQIGSLNPGEEVQILDGPECADGYIWWYVESKSRNLKGWTAAGNSSSYYLIPKTD